MIKKLLTGVSFLIILLFASGLLNTAMRRRKQTVQAARDRKAAQRFRDSTFRANNIDTLRTYSQAACLRFHGKPLLAIGQQIANLPATFDYRANLELERFGEPFMYEYVSFDSYYSAANGDLGPNGSLWLMTDANGRILGLHGVWVITSIPDKKERLAASQEIINWLPCLRGQLDFEHYRKIVLEGKEFKEEFEMTPANDSTWGRLNYHVKLKPLL